MTDAEKLIAYAKEVRAMLDAQKAYFAGAKKGRADKLAPDEVKKLLQDSITQETRVRKLTDKVLNPQTTIV